MNGESHLLGPGGLLHIPPNVEHWGEVVGDEPVLNLDVFTPLREEYAPAPKKALTGALLGQAGLAQRARIFGVVFRPAKRSDPVPEIG